MRKKTLLTIFLLTFGIGGWVGAYDYEADLKVLSELSTSKKEKSRIDAGYLLAQSWLTLAGDKASFSQGYKILLNLLDDTSEKVTIEAISAASTLIMLSHNSVIHEKQLLKDLNTKTLKARLMLLSRSKNKEISERAFDLLKRLEEAAGQAA